MNKEYLQFIESKKHSSINYGIEPIEMSSKMFDYQKKVCEYAIKKGRCAVFLDTGLGKTIIELTVAKNYYLSTKKPVLIITPLAVAFQFIKEADKFGINDISYSKDGRYKTSIVVCNYERLDKFNSDHFDCVILDESSILKNFDGATKSMITSFMKKVKYRFLFTATPSPNDFIELGTSSEALGYMGYTDMLGKFFSNNEKNIKATDKIGNKFYLKPHAKDNFFKWVSSWSISMRRPSDLGYSDDRHILPNLILNHHNVRNDEQWVVNGQVMMFAMIAQRLTEVRQEQKMTIDNRCQKAVDLAKDKDYTVYWCNFNEEGRILGELDKSAIEISGSMSLDKKEGILLDFANGNITKLITKAKITAFGLNWQHCAHTVYFPTFSYEQYYQAIRRFYRFGQERNVIVDLVYSEGQKRVIDSLIQKTKKADELFTKLNSTLNSTYTTELREFNQQIQKPKW
jgi:SNF2 family DNA or RNA helicase